MNQEITTNEQSEIATERERRKERKKHKELCEALQAGFAWDEPSIIL